MRSFCFQKLCEPILHNAEVLRHSYPCKQVLEASHNPSIFRIDVGMSRGFNLMDYNEDFILSRTPQVLKVDYTNTNPEMSVIKSVLKNTLLHAPRISENPYKSRYKKYKLKYTELKKK